MNARLAAAAVVGVLYCGSTAAPPAAAQNAATTVQLPTFGVAIDAAGVLQVKAFEDPGGRLAAERARAAQAALPGDLAAVSPCRKVSLVRLEAAVRRVLDEGRKPDDAMRYLAGLQRVQYVFFFPDARDIVIAGPAEGFAADPSGRVCGIGTGRPVLELDDLVTALRAFPPGTLSRPFLGCTIDPPQAGLARLQQFQRTVPHVVPEAQRQAAGAQIATGMREALGMADVRVFGVPADTHFARVLVEADYRMKRIGIGLEPPPVRLASYLDLLGTMSVRQAALERWWFVPDYRCVRVTADKLGMELVGQGVQLLCEEKLIGQDGQLKSGAQSNRASERFTAGFTQQYPELAARSPVFAELRNLIDLSVAAAFVQKQQYAEKAGWRMSTFADEQVLPVRTGLAPKQVAAAVQAAWKGSRFFALAGGGVSIRPDQALAAENLLADEQGTLARSRDEIARKLPPDRWWWD